MQQIAAEQIRGARGILDWTRKDLAAACGLAASTIRNLEDGKITPRDDTTRVICQAFERQGLEFIPDGIRKLRNEVRSYNGSDCRQIFYKDIMKAAVSERCDEILALSISQETLANVFCNQIGLINRLCEFAKMKCLIEKDTGALSGLANVQFREVRKEQCLLPSCFVYGNKYVIVQQYGKDNFHFCICYLAVTANFFRDRFNLLWKRSEEIVGGR